MRNEELNIEAQGRNIADRFRDAGGFMSRPGRSKELVEIRKEAEEWIAAVEQGIASQDSEGICHYLSWYDIVHRIAFGIPGDGSFMDQWQNHLLSNIATSPTRNAASSSHNAATACRQWLLNAVRNRLTRSPHTVSPRLRNWCLAQSVV